MAYNLANLSSKERATADLILIAFFYLLRVGEYTTPRRVRRNNEWVRATRTIQFRTKDVGFWKNGMQLDRNSPLPTLLTADAATLKISNQKNGRMGQTIHQESIQANHCPVKALARRLSHILNNGGNDDTLICMYKNNENISAVTPADLIQAIRASVRALKLHKAGIDPDIVGVHSLRAGGAMALKLHSESDTTIMKHGRWSGLTFLQYIHNQIGHLSKDLSKKWQLRYHSQTKRRIRQHRLHKIKQHETSCPATCQLTLGLLKTPYIDYVCNDTNIRRRCKRLCMGQTSANKKLPEKWASQRGSLKLPSKYSKGIELK